VTVQISPIFGAGAQRFTNTGPNGLVPNASGFVYTYQAGTSTPQATYTDQTGGTANSNPIILDANGRVPNEIWLTAGQSYKFVETDQFGTTLGTWDLIPGIASNIDIASIQATLTGYAASFTTVALTVTGATSLNTLTVSGASTFSGPINAGANTLTVGAITSSGAFSATTGTFTGAVTAPSFSSAAATPVYLGAAGAAIGTSWAVDTSQFLRNVGNTQPSCFAGLTANQTSGSTLICNSTGITGGHNYSAPYATGTGLFTAPQPGVYSFGCSGTINNNTGAASSCNIAVLVNATQVDLEIMNFPAFSGQSFGFAIPAIALAAGQTLSVQLVAGGTFTAFSGTQYAVAGASFSCRLMG
jgi:hypothetical protein